ncbi:MAG: sigma-70 family RNA polymerase sigma factor [Bacteroidales bacterium]|nr:sigma-70 family RNA polymerase sigma factor [Bacteroidales bacterium]
MDGTSSESHMRFRTLWHRYEHLVRWQCLRAAHGNAEKARDMVQESALRILTYCDTITDDVQQFGGRKWLLKVVDSAIAAYRRKEPAVISLDEPSLSNMADDQSDVEARELLDDLMSDLADTERRFMQLFLDGYDLNDLALVFGLSYKAASARFVRIRRKIILRARQQHYIQ